MGLNKNTIQIRTHYGLIAGNIFMLALAVFLLYKDYKTFLIILMSADCIYAVSKSAIEIWKLKKFEECEMEYGLQDEGDEEKWV